MFIRGGMASLYSIVMIVHVATAVIGFGQTFLFPFLLRYPRSEAEARTVLMLLGQMGKLAKYSDLILLGSGVGMLCLGYPFESWVIASLILFFTMRFSSSVLSRKAAISLWNMLHDEAGAYFMEEYRNRMESFLPKVWFTQALNIAIILLMILKP
ncbi:DUF2269 family protein [Rossellomorea marisflavi]|uniref:DUF2269 family protein n=2 Tax=Rossellomorea marisflavi TaxID=189381 RepID=UPI001BC96B59|nr:DUF2269 family protein [Rossellomorea marisflavi]